MLHENEFLENILLPLISINTSINPGEHEFPSSQITPFFNNLAEKYGYTSLSLQPQPWYKTPNTNDRIYPLAYYKQGENRKTPIVLFLGHHDVVPVPPQEHEEWRTDPFQPTIEGDKITGRGSLDMKGAVAAYFAAFANEPLENGTIIIAISGDEETGGKSSMPYLIQELQKHNLMPDYVINGEPSFTPVIVTKRRGTTTLKVRFPLEQETAHGILKQKIFISTQGNGSGTLHTALFTLGSDSHAMFTAGKLAAITKIVSLETSSNKSNSVPKKVLLTYVEDPLFGDPKQSKTYTYSKGLTQIMQALPSLPSLPWPTEKSLYGVSIGPNVYKQKQDYGELYIDIRSMIHDDNTHEKIRALVEHHFQSFHPNVTVSIESHINSMLNKTPSQLPQILKTIALKHEYPVLQIGEKLGGASDSRYFTAKGIPTVELGPQGMNAHGPNEWVSKTSLLKLIRIYHDVAIQLITQFPLTKN